MFNGEHHCSIMINCWTSLQSRRNLSGWMWWTDELPSIISIHAILEGSLHLKAPEVACGCNHKRQQIQWLHEKWHQAFWVSGAAEALNCNCRLWKADDCEESLQNKPLGRCAALDNWIGFECHFKIAKAITLKARGNYERLAINTRNAANWRRSFWPINNQRQWRGILEKRPT